MDQMEWGEKKKKKKDKPPQGGDGELRRAGELRGLVGGRRGRGSGEDTVGEM